MRLGGAERAVHRGLVDRAVGEDRRRPGGREGREDARREPGGVRRVGPAARAGRCSGRARSAGRGAKPEAGVRAAAAGGRAGRPCPGSTTHGRRSIARRPPRPDARGAAPTKAIRPAASTTSSPSGSWRVPPAVERRQDARADRERRAISADPRRQASRATRPDAGCAARRAKAPGQRNDPGRWTRVVSACVRAARLALLASDFEEVGGPLGTAAIERRRTAVPAAGAGDGLRLVLVLVDDVLERLDGRRWT